MNRDRLSLMTFNFALDILLRKMKVRDIIGLVREEGIPYVDLMRIKKGALPTYLSAMHENGIKAGCYIMSASFFADDAKIRSSLREELSTAKALSAQRMMIVPYAGSKDLRLAVSMGRETVIDKMIHGFGIAVQEGEKAGIPICFELTPHDELCLSGTKDCLRVLGEVDGLGLVFDTANMLPNGDDPLAAYEALKQYIVHVHLKDVALLEKQGENISLERSADGRVMRCVVWGDGVIPIKEIYRRLLSDGYAGLFAIEYSHPEKLVCGPDGHSAHLRRFLEY